MRPTSQSNRARWIGRAIFIRVGCCIFASHALAQPVANVLVPGIAPVAAQASPREAAEIRSGGAAAVTAPETYTGALHSNHPTVDYDYRLGAGDHLRVIVFGEPNLSAEYAVAGNGMISFPMVGNVRAAGRTVGDVRDDLVAGLKNGYIRNPEVSAEVVTFRPFYILGEVTRPGEYPYSDQITVMDAVATAGGFTVRANRRIIFVKHPSEATEHRERLAPGLMLQPGDTVRVGERLF